MIKHSLYISCLMILMVFLSTCTKINIKKQGCDDSTLEKYIPDENLTIIVPNVITPNGDAKNEVFHYWIMNKDLNNQSIPSFAYIVFKLYNEDKKLVYENEDYQNDFTGNDADGKTLPEGTYQYELFLDENFVKGKLCIIRTNNVCTDHCKSTDENDPLLLYMSCN